MLIYRGQGPKVVHYETLASCLKSCSVVYIEVMVYKQGGSWCASHQTASHLWSSSPWGGVDDRRVQGHQCVSAMPARPVEDSARMESAVLSSAVKAVRGPDSRVGLRNDPASPRDYPCRAHFAWNFVTGGRWNCGDVFAWPGCQGLKMEDRGQLKRVHEL